jgi:hypothetical protein
MRESAAVEQSDCAPIGLTRGFFNTRVSPWRRAVERGPVGELKWGSTSYASTEGTKEIGVDTPGGAAFVVSALAFQSGRIGKSATRLKRRPRLMNCGRLSEQGHSIGADVICQPSRH